MQLWRRKPEVRAYRFRFDREDGVYRELTIGTRWCDSEEHGLEIAERRLREQFDNQDEYEYVGVKRL